MKEHRLIVRLPEIEIPQRIDRRKTPTSVAEAEEERRQLGILHQELEGAIGKHRRDCDADWLARITAKSRIVGQRISFLKAWKKTANRAAALHAVTLACGGDLDDPVALVVGLRDIVLGLRQRLVDAGHDKPLTIAQLRLLDIAHAYGQIMARGDVEAGEADDMVEAIKSGAQTPADVGAQP